MALRPAKCYRKLERPYTRKSRVKKKNYVKSTPPLKIHRFETGERKDYEKKLYLIAKRAVQIRHNALEAMRQAVIKHISKHTKDFFLKVLVYPHHILRENPLATGAGADRFQTGMRLSFGNPIGVAVQVKQGQRIMEVNINNNNLEFAKRALKIASMKSPTPCRIEIVDK